MGCKDIGIRKLDFFLQKLNSFKGESVQKLKGEEPSPPPPPDCLGLRRQEVLIRFASFGINKCKISKVKERMQPMYAIYMCKYIFKRSD